MPNHRKPTPPGTKGRRISGAEREKIAVQIAEQYNAGMTIREVAETHGRSYGFTHRVLVEGGVALRGRGGAGHGRLVK